MKCERERKNGSETERIKGYICDERKRNGNREREKERRERKKDVEKKKEIEKERSRRMKNVLK